MNDMENTGLFNSEGKELSISEVLSLFPSNEDIEKTFPILDSWSINDKCYELGKIRGAQWMLASIKFRSL
jgi:hypothetical protein